MLTNLRRQFFCLNNVDRTTRASLLGFIGEVIIIRSFLIPVGRKSTTDMDEQVVSMMVQLLFKLGELAIESDLCCDQKLSEITANGLVGCMSSERRVFKKDNPMTGQPSSSGLRMSEHQDEESDYPAAPYILLTL